MGALEECPYDLDIGNEVKFPNIEVETDTLAIEEAVKVLLQCLGEDFNREGLRKTPLRVARALREGTRGYTQNVKDIVEAALFPEAGLASRVGHAGGAGGLVVVRDLDLFSYCESCLLPFQVKCHIGYVPSGQRVLGLSKLSRVAEMFAKRLQNPHRLADEICSALQHGIEPDGAAVILQCCHIHFPDLGSALFNPNHKGLVTTVVKSGLGAFRDEFAGIWDDLISLLRFEIEEIRSTSSSNTSWCPARSFCKLGESDPSMLRAVATILCSIGEDPSRKELVETPACFVNWMMNFKSCNLNLKLHDFPRTKRDSFGFPNGDEHAISSELSLSFWSQCEHHLLPFYGVVHIGYYGCDGSNPPIGKSFLQSVVHFYGFKLQVQERMTRQIAETASSLLGEDVIVVVEASHTCMLSRGIEKLGSTTATIALLGRFSTDSSARAKFLQMLPR